MHDIVQQFHQLRQVLSNGVVMAISQKPSSHNAARHFRGAVKVRAVLQEPDIQVKRERVGIASDVNKI